MLVIVLPQTLHSNVYLTSWEPRRRVQGSADLRFITDQQSEQQGGTIAGENSVGIVSVYMAFPSPDKVGGAKDTQRGPEVSCCKPETLVDSGPIMYTARTLIETARISEATYLICQNKVTISANHGP